MSNGNETKHAPGIVSPVNQSDISFDVKWPGQEYWVQVFRTSEADQGEAFANLIARAPSLLAERDALRASLTQLLSWSEHQAAAGCKDIEPHRHARAALAIGKEGVS